MTTDAALIDQWRSLLAGYSGIAHDLDRELQTGHGMTMSDYEVLDRLMGLDECKARVQELGGDMHLSQSALSRTVGRLEKCGLVERAICDTDRRGIFVTPTPEGRRVHEAARLTYLSVLTSHLG